MASGVRGCVYHAAPFGASLGIKDASLWQKPQKKAVAAMLPFPVPRDNIAHAVPWLGAV